MEKILEITQDELGLVSGGDGIVVVAGPGGEYIDNGGSCSPGNGTGGGGIPIPPLNASLGVRG